MIGLLLSQEVFPAMCFVCQKSRSCPILLGVRMLPQQPIEHPANVYHKAHVLFRIAVCSSLNFDEMNVVFESLACFVIPAILRKVLSKALFGCFYFAPNRLATCARHGQNHYAIPF